MIFSRFNSFYLLFVASLFLFEGCSSITRYTENEYFPNGDVKKELIYRGNTLKRELVKIIQYYPSSEKNNPSKQYELSYSGGAMHELQKYWFKNGSQEMILNYQNGLKHGKQEVWYENGEKKFLSNYFLGKKNGIDESWNSDGSLDRKKLYKFGMLIRIFKD